MPRVGSAPFHPSRCRTCATRPIRDAWRASDAARIAGALRALADASLIAHCRVLTRKAGTSEPSLRTARFPATFRTIAFGSAGASRWRKRRRSARSTFPVLHLGELGIDDVAFVALLATARLTARLPGRAAGSATCRARLRLLGRIHLLAELLRSLRQCFRLRAHRRLVAVLDGVLGLLDCGFDRGLLARVDLVAVFGQRLPDRVHETVGLVARLDELAELLVFF